MTTHDGGEYPALDIATLNTHMARAAGNVETLIDLYLAATVLGRPGIGQMSHALIKVGDLVLDLPEEAVRIMLPAAIEKIAGLLAAAKTCEQDTGQPVGGVKAIPAEDLVAELIGTALPGQNSRVTARDILKALRHYGHLAGTQ